MAFDSTKPAANSPIVSQELRDQFNALKEQVDAQQAQITSLQQQIGTKAFMPQMGEFDPGMHDPPQLADLQAVQDYLNQLIIALENAP
jgi:division protein CdvB (Snf7/Vps24/ESCRT-III family)